MAAWKVLVVMLLAAICFALAMGTIVVPITLTDEQNRWVWFGGLLGGTVVMGTLFTLFLRAQDKKKF
jgi:uncharacterized membrane protein YdcZ (DUF606 family)